MGGEPIQRAIETAQNVADQPASASWWGAYVTKGALGAAVLAGLGWVMQMAWGRWTFHRDKWDAAAASVQALQQHVADEIAALNKRNDDAIQASRDASKLTNDKLDLIVQLVKQNHNP